jgi:hypothetical protein
LPDDVVVRWGMRRGYDGEWIGKGSTVLSKIARGDVTRLRRFSDCWVCMDARCVFVCCVDKPVVSCVGGDVATLVYGIRVAGLTFDRCVWNRDVSKIRDKALVLIGLLDYESRQTDALIPCS